MPSSYRLQIHFLQVPDWKVRVSAARALGKLGEAALASVPHLQDLENESFLHRKEQRHEEKRYVIKTCATWRVRVVRFNTRVCRGTAVGAAARRRSPLGGEAMRSSGPDQSQEIEQKYSFLLLEVMASNPIAMASNRIASCYLVASIQGIQAFQIATGKVRRRFLQKHSIYNIYIYTYYACHSGIRGTWWCQLAAWLHKFALNWWTGLKDMSSMCL